MIDMAYGHKQPFLWNFITSIRIRDQTGSEEGFTESTNEESNSSMTDFLTESEESLTASTNEETNSTITSFVTGAKESDKVHEDVNPKVLSVLYDKKVLT